MACLDCGTLTLTPKHGRCPVHATAYVSRPKPKPRPQYGYAWRRLSEEARKDQPWCSRCGHQGSPRNPLTLDHLMPVAQAGPAIPSPEGRQVLCRRCNSGKRVRLEPRGGLST